MGLKEKAIALGLSLFGATGAHRLVAPLTRGPGAILMFHRVDAAAPPTPGFDPNRGLTVTPAHLDETLTLVRRLGFEIISMDEASRRLRAGLRRDAPFVVLTFDDGYRDTLTQATPILRRHAAPFAVYVVPGYADGTARLWWLELEEAVRRLEHVEIEIAGQRLALPAWDAKRKSAAFKRVYWALRARPDAELYRGVEDLAIKAGVDPGVFAPSLCMNWDELAVLAADPLCTIGAHTMTHPRLAKIPVEAARAEMAQSRAVIRERLGRDPVHFCYPVGDPTSAGAREFTLAAELGFETAVTTRPGMLFVKAADAPFALPRVSVNGGWQRPEVMEILLSGAPFALWSAASRLRRA
jgi:peptidoglycan/xylan/chitin deacetylase (PgdA/CDA1 family)